MKLLIISHTEHYITEDGQIVGWGPTVTEINHLIAIFERIEHVAMLKEGTAPPSALPYTSDAITFTPIPSVGGHGISAKSKILWQAPKTLRIIAKALKRADVFQFRAPTGIGVYVIPYLMLRPGLKGWFKYAGNWNQNKPPLGYDWQRWLLKQQSRKVTINGHWPQQPKHCVSFENPCLTESELEEGTKISEQKSWFGPIDLCYVGRLETPKGVGRILEAIALLEPKHQKRIGTLHLVGDGPERAEFEDLTKTLNIAVKFHGFLKRSKVFEIYKACHYFVMPTTASEGFPKVIAEAYNFGCIPIVSNISAIGHYIKDQHTGYVLDQPTALQLAQKLRDLLKNQGPFNPQILDKRPTFVQAFSFKYYNQRLAEDILNTD